MAKKHCNRRFKIKSMILFWGFLLWNFYSSFAQNRVGQTMPNVMMRLINGDVFNSQTLPKNKATILFYFSPDCDHCAHLTQTLLANKSLLTDKNIIMVTFFSMKETIAFAEKNKLQQLKNLYIGSEGNRFVVPKYFHIGQFPFVAFLNAQQTILQTFPSQTKEPIIIQSLKKLK